MEYIISQYDINKLNSRIKEIRDLRNETQESLAKKLGIKRQAIINWEKEKNPTTPTIENLVELCKTLDCNMDYLLGAVDTLETEPISKASHYSGISAKIIRYCIENPDYRDCLNFFMNPDNCAELFNDITLNMWKKYQINSQLAEIKSPLKDEIINAFDEFISFTPFSEVNKNTYKNFLKQKFPKDKLILSTEKKEAGITVKGCIKLIIYQNFFKNKEFNYK